MKRRDCGASVAHAASSVLGACAKEARLPATCGVGAAFVGKYLPLALARRR
jgi:hypothetical protein